MNALASPLLGFLLVLMSIACMHSYVMAEDEEKDLGRQMIVTLMLKRTVHSLISLISVSRRQRMPMGRKKSWTISFELEQVDCDVPGKTKSSYTLSLCTSQHEAPRLTHLPLYMETRRSQPHGSLALLHADPVELLYYWFYRARHDSTTTSLLSLPFSPPP
ncbi:unnamed protein product [Brassica napus]|uniref:(rape) hypothetical protein n=1 Tax=Brassica napus TaxID=3708 RepID=A0A816VT31_BRANA|nr:unnamed protein product [Brassica napus]